MSFTRLLRSGLTSAVWQSVCPHQRWISCLQYLQSPPDSVTGLQNGSEDGGLTKRRDVRRLGRCGVGAVAADNCKCPLPRIEIFRRVIGCKRAPILVTSKIIAILQFKHVYTKCCTHLVPKSVRISQNVCEMYQDILTCIPKPMMTSYALYGGHRKAVALAKLPHCI